MNTQMPAARIPSPQCRLSTLLLMGIACSIPACGAQRDTTPAGIAHSIRRMSVGAKVNQLFFVRVRTAEIQPGSEALAEIGDLIHEGIGGAVLSASSLQEADRVARTLDALAEQPLLFAANFESECETDTRSSADPRTRFPDALGIAASGSPRLAQRVAQQAALEQRAVGIDWTLRPTPSTDRFGDRAAHVTRFFRATTRGLEAAGMTSRLGFGGAVLENTGTAARTAVDKLHAGAGVMLVSKSPAATRATILRAIEDGNLSEDKLDAAVARIMLLKKRAGVLANRVRERAPTDWSAIGRPEARAVADEAARRSLVLIRDRAYFLPIRDVGNRPLLLSVRGRSRHNAQSSPREHGAGSALFDALRKQDPRFARIVVTPDRPEAFLERTLRRCRSASTLVVALHRATLSEASMELLRACARMGRTVFVAFRDPSPLAKLPKATSCLIAVGAGAPVERAVAHALFGAATIDGRMPISVAGLARVGDGITLGSATDSLRKAPPIEQDLESSLPQRVREFVEWSIGQKTFPGCQIVVARRNAIVLNQAYGTETYAEDSARISRATRYDLASLTKIVATTPVAMVLHSNGSLRLDAKAADILPSFRGSAFQDVTIEQLLTHSAGFPGWLPLYKGARGRDAILDKILSQPKAYEPGARWAYSDLGFIMLGVTLEQLGGATLDRLAEKLVFAPLRMRATSFGPLPDTVAVAPTEIMPGRGLVHRTVHDENSEAFGGVAGHAGLFSTAADVARLGRCILAGGILDGVRVFDRRTVDLFAKRTSKVLGSNRALGFETPSPQSSAGRLMSKNSIGHTGFTGTSIWMDRARDLLIVCLTNRVHPTRANHRVQAFRRALHNLVIEQMQIDYWSR